LKLKDPASIEAPQASFHQQGHDKKTAIDTSEPYTGAIRGTMHKPQANLGVDQNFSPVKLKTRKGGISQNLG